MTEFKFNVGELVLYRAGIEEAMMHCRNGNGHVPLVYVLVERMSQECSGGVQLVYKLKKQGEALVANEPELAKLSSWNSEEAQRTMSEARARAEIIRDAAIETHYKAAAEKLINKSE